MPDTELVCVTYREIAERFDIGIEGARLKAKRRAAKGLWRIIPGNHPQDPIRIEMPAADFAPSSAGRQRRGPHKPEEGVPTDVPPQTPNSRDPNDLAVLVDAVSKLTAQAADLTERLLRSEQGRAEAERMAAVSQEKADNLAAQLDVERHQASKLRAERDEALERLDRAVERLDRVQAEHYQIHAEHVAELAVIREQMTRAEHDRDRATAELAVRLALPWWRRLFA